MSDDVDKFLVQGSEQLRTIPNTVITTNNFANTYFRLKSAFM